MTSMPLRTAFSRCEAIVRDRARNFWYGLRLTPEPKRSAMYAVYAWMRAVDDIADAEGADAARPADRQRALAEFRRDTERALRGDVPAHAAPGRDAGDRESLDRAAMWQALAAIAPTYHLVVKDFQDMIDGQLADTGTVAIASWQELRDQCYRVASTVGLVCVSVWGVRSAAPARQQAGERITDEVRSLAIDRGIAFQLTNILRDIREDHDVGRVYLPRAELEAAGLTIDSLLAWTDAGRCTEFMRAQIDRARAHYRQSEGLEALISPECVPTLWAMTAIYRSLLDRIARDPRRVIGAARVRVPTWEKLWIGFKAKRMAARANPAGDRLAPEVATP